MIGEDLKRLLDDICKARIAVLGDYCLDAYWFVDRSREEISVETGLPTRPVMEQRYSLGGAGNVVMNLVAMGVDMVSLSAHKLQGPKGVGALWVREGVPIEPLHVGGGQERERRPGTENVAGIVGFGAAVRLLLERRDEAASRVRSLASRLMETLRREVPDCVLYGSAFRRLPNILCLGFPGADGAALVMRMDRAGVAISSGAACSSGSIEPSHVVMSLGVGREAAACAIRIASSSRPRTASTPARSL